MKILATITLRGRELTQAWDFVEGIPEPAIVLQQLEGGGIIGISLDPDQIEDLLGHPTAKKKYTGNLDFSQGRIIGKRKD